MGESLCHRKIIGTSLEMYETKVGNIMRQSPKNGHLHRKQHRTKREIF